MPAVSFHEVAKTYPAAKGPLKALDGVTFAIEEGEFFGLLGPNGAGKTTLISVLAGLAKATSGRVEVLGHDVVADYAEARRRLGVVPQELVFDPFFSVRETLVIQSGYFGVRHNGAWIDELLGALGLADKADANMRQLSGGMKRRVLVAQALVHKPPVIVLDEPTAGVDVELRQTLWQFVARLNREGRTVLLTTHYLEEAEALCHRVAMLKQGRVVALDRTSALLAGTASPLLRKEILRFRKVAMQTVAAPVLTALLYLVIFGQVLEGRVTVFGSVGYTSFLVPGLVMMSVLQNAFANSSSSLIQSKITGNLVFTLLAPLSPATWFGAYTGASIVRGLAVGAGVLLATWWFTHLAIVNLAWIVVFAVLGAALMGALGVIAGLWADKFDQIAAFQNFVVLPMTMLSGVFYSVDSLPSPWREASHLNPFFFMIDGFRHGFFGKSDVDPWISLGVVAVTLAVVCGLALHLLRIGYKIRH